MPEPSERELLIAAARALRSFALVALTIKPALDAPYRDDPRWSPWTRWIEPEARRAHDLSAQLRERLAQDGAQIRGPDRAMPGLWPKLPPEAEQVAILRAAIQRVLDDEESGESGWGPDVTMVYVLREAMEATGGAPSPAQPGRPQ